MNRIAFLLKVKQDRLEEYKEIHQAVWPEMLDALSRAGWHNYSIFLSNDGQLFGYFETPGTFENALASMAETEINTKWQIKMAPFFESPDEARPDESLIQLEEVFHLN